MASAELAQLLKDEKVLKEIEKFKWIESEKVGHDIGFAKASEDWLSRYGKEWSKTCCTCSGKSIKAPAKSARTAKRA